MPHHFRQLRVTALRRAVARGYRPATAVAGFLTLAACQTFSPDGGLNVAASVAHRELRADVVALRTPQDAAAAQARVAALLKRSLTANTAVQIALLNNRGLQAAYNDLGIAEAAMVRESLPPNPSVSITRISGSIETEIERQIVGNILALATLPARSEIAATRFRQAQLAAALATLRVAEDARRAFYRAVAARQVAGLLSQSHASAATTVQLAERLRESGAMTKLDHAREQAFQADLTTQLASARLRASSERENLIRVLGLSVDRDIKLPDKLPVLPRQARTRGAVEQEALSRRVDLQIARLELETLAKSYGLTKATRLVNVLDAGYSDKIAEDKTTGETARDRGFTVAFELPIFDFGETRLREAEQNYMKALNELAHKAVVTRSQAREAYRRYRSSYDVAAHYQREVLPLRKTISDELMLRYNAMQIDVFTLLADARQGIAARVAAVEAQRDFWLASTDLSAAISGGAATEPSGEAARTGVPVAAAAAGH
jgi:outer membrane protein TolC